MSDRESLKAVMSAMMQTVDYGGAVYEEKAEYLLAALEASGVRLAKVKRLEEALKLGKIVMDMLDEHGPSIVPHLLDTDENAGQRFRAAIRAMGD